MGGGRGSQRTVDVVLDLDVTGQHLGARGRHVSTELAADAIYEEAVGRRDSQDPTEELELHALAKP